MSHILKKIAIAGAGGGKNQEPEPPIYKPPVLGELQYGSSFSYSETLDLVSDGPIEGLCNKYGVVQDADGIFQGIYLDDTPVAVSITNEDDPMVEERTETEQEVLQIRPATLDSSSGTGVKSCRRFFQALNQQKRHSRGGYISTLRINGSRGNYLTGEKMTDPHVSMFLLRWRKKSSRCKHLDPKSKSKYLTMVRAYIRYDGSTDQRYYWFINGNRRDDLNLNSQGNARYSARNKPVGRFEKLYWLDTNSLSSSTKFFFGFGHRSGGGFWSRQLWKKTSDASEQMVYNDIQTIIDLWNNNNDSLNPDANIYQRQLAEMALSRLNWNGSQLHPGAGAGNGLFTNWLEKSNGRKCHVVVRVESYNAELVGKTVLENGEVAPMRTYSYGQRQGWNLEKVLKSADIRFADVTCPEVDSNGIMNGKMHGFIVYQFKHLQWRTKQRCSQGEFARSYTVAVPKKVKDALKDIKELRYTREIREVHHVNEFETSNLKYNFSNVLAEVRKGEEDQLPLNYFKNVFIDHPYNAKLFGPFSSKAKIFPQRINPNTDMLTRSKVLTKDADNYNLDLDSATKLPLNEGSDDERVDAGGDTRDYSSWANNSLIRWDEQAIPATHTIYNPNVKSCFITLNVSNLRDTLVTEVDNVGGNSSADLKVGTTFPTVLNIKVETGTIDKMGGQEEPFRTYHYRIVALIEGETLIDIGNPDLRNQKSDRDFVIGLNKDERRNRLWMPFELPPVSIKHNEVLTADGERGIEAGTIDQDSVEERYIRVTKLSFETNSVLLSKEVALNKVTEIIEVNLPYPFSAIIGTKLDSRAFGAIPKRSYDLKLKKVKVPSNYYPTIGGVDKRYFKNVGDEALGAANSQRGSYYYTKAKNPESLLVYDGDWDGEWNEELQWTDNPAWILYDLLTNQRYGMGAHIDVSTINKWQLYKIGRFCDAVDDNGYFEGVTDGRGGREPRFSCNIVFDQGQKIYDAINTIAGLFRGRVFFGNSEINFVDDRPRRPVNLFTNESVKDGLFFYSNNRRDEQYNTIEVGFRDRFDNFSPKVEVIEDEDDIKQRGIFKKRIEGVGITSRAMARRMGQHQMFHSIEENQTVAFTAGLETLLCQPGDLVIIEDELKTNKANFGKVLAVNLEEETIRLSNTFSEATMTGKLTIFNPTGRDTIEDIDQFAELHRTRYASFTLTGDGTETWAGYTGDYGFSGYIQGFPDAVEGNGEERYEQYAVYSGFTTGIGGGPRRQTEIYFETGVTGWVFASGSQRLSYSGDFISPYTGNQTLLSFDTGDISGGNFLSTWDGTVSDRRGSFVPFTGFDQETMVGPYQGVMNAEISGSSPEQISVLNVTGGILSTPSQLKASGLNPYGSLVSGFDKPHLLPFVKLGSPAKFEIKDASPFIYKVISLKEQQPNQYLVSATKYNTGKFNLIEKNISIEDQVDTYSYQVAQEINGIAYTTLQSPIIDSLTTGVPNVASQTFSVTGMWNNVENSTGYNVILTYPNGETEEDDVTTTGHEFTGLAQVGVFRLCVNALGNNGGIANQNAYFDSVYNCSGMFVVYDELFTFNRPFLEQITLM